MENESKLRAPEAFHVIFLVVGVITIFAQSASRGGVLDYDIIEVGILGISSQASAINTSGQVAGTFVSAEEHGRAFVYSPGGMTDIGTLGGTNSYAQGINALGQVVGETYLAGDNIQRGFLYSNGVYRTSARSAEVKRWT